MVVDLGVFIEHICATDKTRPSLMSIAALESKYVTTATVYELLCGAAAPEKVADVTILLSGFTELLINRLVATQAAALFINLRRRNQLIGPLDILIAATALVYKLPVKTLNVNHFGRVDGLIIS